MDMKNFVLLIFIITSFVFSHLFAQNCGTKWWEKEFIIGTTYDPPVKYVYDEAVKNNNILLAEEAGFNFFSGEQVNHKNGNWWGRTSRANEYVYLKEHSNNCRVLFLQWFLPSVSEILNNTDNIDNFVKGFYSLKSQGFNVSSISSLDGIHLTDEPIDNNIVSDVYKAFIDLLKDSISEDKLYFVNFPPSYMNVMHGSNYHEYLKKYFYPNTPLQVACFDNYFPTSYFENKPLGNNSYYYNLALMRHMADTAGVPLWSYINTCEPRYITAKDSLWQAASMRLAAFAPIAYGATGLMYFSYDSRHPNQVSAKLWNNTGGMSDENYYMRLPTDTTENVFIGHLRDGAKTDIAVKRDTNLGDWFIKKSDSIMTDSIDLRLGWYGHRNVMIPFLCYRPDLGRDVIAGLHRDGKLLLTDTLAGWEHTITLPGVQQDWWQSLTEKKVSSFSLDGSTMDFCVAKTGSGRDTLFIYKNLQMHPADYTHNAPQKIALEQGEHVIQLIRDEGQLYVATRKRDILMHTPIITNRIHRIYKSGNNYTTQSVTLIYPTNIVADHFWVENTDSLRIYMQPVPVGENKNIYVGSIDWNNSPCRMSVTNFISDALLFCATGLRRYGTQIYDRFGIWDKRVYDEALIDGLGNPTMRYYMAKQNNLYIRDVLSPIVMGAEWKGAWHTPPLSLPREYVDMYASDKQGGYVKMLESNSDPLLKNMEDNMIAGKFETDSCYYYFFVDKGGEEYTNCEIRLADDGISAGTRRVEALQSLSGEPRQLTSHQNADGTVTFTWDNMLGGELVPIKIMK